MTLFQIVYSRLFVSSLQNAILVTLPAISGLMITGQNKLSHMSIFS